MDLKNKHLEYKFCLCFADENLLKRMVFDGAGGAGGARQETGPKGPDKKDAPPPAPTEQHALAEAATKGETRTELQGIKVELSPEAIQSRLNQIATRQTELLKKKEATAEQTKKTVDAKEPWVTKQPAFPENQPYKAKIAGGYVKLDATKERIAQAIENKMSDANYAALIKDLMPQDMPLTENNKTILRNILTAMVDSYLHRENPDADTAKKYGKEVLLPRFENFLSGFQKLAGKDKPIKVMIEFSAFLAKVDSSCDFINKDGVILPGIQNVLQVSDPAKLLDLFKQHRELDNEDQVLNKEKLNVEMQRAVTQNQPIDIEKIIKTGELKFTPATFVLPTDPTKIDEALTTELTKTIDAGLIVAIREKALEYLKTKAQSLKEPGAKLSVTEDGKITLITPADEDKQKKDSEQAAQKSNETAAQLSGNPTVKEGIQEATDNIGLLLTKFFQVFAEWLKKLGLTFEQLETLNFDQALKKWNPPPTEKETAEAKGLYETIKKAAPRLNKSFEGLLANPEEMRKILKNKPENISWQTYLFNSGTGHINKTELAQLQDSNKQLTPTEISEMILSEKKAGEEIADEQAPASASSMPKLDDKSFMEGLTINALKVKYTAQDVDQANQSLGNDAESIKKNMSRYLNQDHDKFNKLIAMSLDSKSNLNPKIREYTQKFVEKFKDKCVPMGQKLLALFPEANGMNGFYQFAENIKKQPDWPNFIKEQLQQSKEFRIKSGFILLMWKNLVIGDEKINPVFQALEQTINELKLADQVKQEYRATFDFDQVMSSLENEFPELAGAIIAKETNPTSGSDTPARSTPAGSTTTGSAQESSAPEIVTAPRYTNSSPESPEITLDRFARLYGTPGVKYTPQDVEALNQAIGKSQDIPKAVRAYMNANDSNFLKVVGMNNSPSSIIKPEVSEAIKKIFWKKAEDNDTKFIKELYPEGNIFEFIKSINKSPNWQQQTKEKLQNSETFQLKVAGLYAIIKQRPDQKRFAPEILDFIEKTIVEMGIQQKLMVKLWKKFSVNPE